MHFHNVVGIRASEKTNRNAEPGLSVDEILAPICLPIATSAQEEYLFKMKFQDFKQLVERAPLHAVNPPEEIIGKLVSNLLFNWLAVLLVFLLLASERQIVKKEGVVEE